MPRLLLASLSVASATSIRVAAVQVASHAGAVLANLARAEPWVVEAARGGAKLVLCPELLAPGYVYDEVIWSSAERRGGPTEAWLTRLSSAHGIHLGVQPNCVVPSETGAVGGTSTRDVVKSPFVVMATWSPPDSHVFGCVSPRRRPGTR
jgi:hypothetical protein